MVEVFKTNVSGKRNARKIIRLLTNKWSNLAVNFDLEDCDKVLRIENKASAIEVDELIVFIQSVGVEIQALE